MAFVRYDASKLTADRLSAEQQAKVRAAFPQDPRTQWEVTKVIYADVRLAQEWHELVSAGKTPSIPGFPTLTVT